MHKSACWLRVLEKKKDESVGAEGGAEVRESKQQKED